MANPEHLKRLKRSVTAWNQWRDENPHIDPDLSDANFNDEDLSYANLISANLANADLRGTYLKCALLADANLSGANLNQADLSYTTLIDADLSRTYLFRANFSHADLGYADLHEARIESTMFVGNNLSRTKNLENVIHEGPSLISVDTIYMSEGKIPGAFLRGAGVPESLITYIPSLLGSGVEFYSCFISYSTKDQEFAARLHDDLQAKGVRCWFARRDIAAGKKIHEQIDEAIRMHEKLLLILSPDSMKSEWVGTEIAKARKREVAEKKQVLFPVRLVDFDTLRDWELYDADTGKDSAREIREYFIPDFSDWKNHDAYKLAFDHLLRDLNAKSITPKT